MREYHVRICEELGVQLPGSTRRPRRSIGSSSARSLYRSLAPPCRRKSDALCVVTLSRVEVNSPSAWVCRQGLSATGSRSMLTLDISAGDAHIFAHKLEARPYLSQLSRRTEAKLRLSQPSTRQPLRADLRARPSWRVLRARRSKARADRITTSRAPKWGSCGQPLFLNRGFRTGARQRIWRSQVYTLSYTKQKGEPAKRGYAIWHGQAEGGGRVVYYVAVGRDTLLHDGCLSQE